MSDSVQYNVAAATGWIGTAFSIIYLIPQVIDTVKTLSAKNVATLTIFSLLVGNILWIIFGIGINSPQIIVGSVPQLIAVIIFLCVKYK